ncbi:MAG: hypothetical protein HOV83_17900 [Catenulispora sp.]|nr:hypothetical protein [Catenulispora sp.]
MNARDRKRVTALIIAALTVSCAGACTKTAHSKTAPPGPTGSVAAPQAAVIAYGYAPDPHGSAVYQPDVVLVGGGPAIVRSVSDDGLTWTIDRHAPNADKLAVGSVMFATSRAVGRVLSLRPQGEDLIVTLAPAGFTDVVKDAHISLDQGLDLSQVIVQQVPGQRDQLSGQDSPTDASTAPADLGTATANATATSAEYRFDQTSDGTIVLPAIQLVAAPAGSVAPAAVSAVSAVSAQGTLPPATPNAGAKIPVTVGAWTATASAEKSALGLQLEHKSTAGLKATVTMKFPIENLHISSDTTVVGGRAAATGFTVSGIKGVEVSLSGGAGNGSADNAKITFQVPVELHFPIPPGPATAGLPVDISLKWSFLVETALTGKNSTVFATGKYKLDGPLGITAHGFQIPALSVQQSILDSISGVAIGPSGIVAATKLKVKVGFGTPAASAGPYVGLTASTGITQGSALGSPLALCRSATLDLKLSTGIGVEITPQLLSFLKALFPAKSKFEGGWESVAETSAPIFSKSQTQPSVALCGG